VTRRGWRSGYHGQPVVSSHGEIVWQVDDALIGIFLLRYKRVGTVGQKDISAAFRNMPAIDGAGAGTLFALPVS
jgi:hypothetical protein